MSKQTRRNPSPIVIDLPNADTALLGLLAEEPKHAYQIEKDVQFREMRTWTDLSMSSIYKVLRKLEEQKLVEAQSEIADGRVRKTYCITELGKESLKAQVRKLLTEPQLVKHPFDVGIYNQELINTAETLVCLEQYRLKLEEFLQGYRALEVFLKEHDCSLGRQALAVRTAFLLQAEIRWVDDFVSKLSQESKEHE